jgi:hypothetical protein
MCCPLKAAPGSGNGARQSEGSRGKSFHFARSPEHAAGIGPETKIARHIAMAADEILHCKRH